jgi:hypothetical protein
MADSEMVAITENPPGARRRRTGRRIVVGLGAVLVVVVAASAFYVVGGFAGSGARGLLSINPTYSCAQGLRFDYDAMLGPTNAETGTDGAAAALRNAIVGPQDSNSAVAGGLPATGWLRVFDSGGTVQFLAPATDPAFGWRSVLATRSGSDWTASASVCAVGPSDDTWDGVAWYLAATPSVQSTTIHAFVLTSPNPCSRLTGWTIKYSVDQVTISFWGRLGDKSIGCSFPSYYIRTDVELKEPLGNRSLVSGVSFPLATPGVLPDQKPDGTWQP